MKSCKNCDRFPFCKFQDICIYQENDTTKTYNDYWIKRKTTKLNKVEEGFFEFEKI